MIAILYECIIIIIYVAFSTVLLKYDTNWCTYKLMLFVFIISNCLWVLQIPVISLKMYSTV